MLNFRISSDLEHSRGSIWVKDLSMYLIDVGVAYYTSLVV